MKLFHSHGRVLSEFPPLSTEALRASLRCVFRELTERVTIVRELLRCVSRELTERVTIVRELLRCVSRELIDRTSDHCQRIAMCTTDTPCPCSFIAWTLGQFFSFKLFASLSRSDGIVARLFQACSFWVFVASATRRRASHVEERCVQGIRTSLAAAKKAKAGKPNRQALWLRAIHVEVRAGRILPDGVTAAVPDAWFPGDSLASTGVSDAELGAAGELATCKAVAKKRKRTAIDPDVKDWFLDHHECMKVKHKRNMRQSWRRAQEMLPSLLGHVNEATYYRWTHSDCAKNKAGRERMPNNLTVLGQVLAMFTRSVV